MFKKLTLIFTTALLLTGCNYSLNTLELTQDNTTYGTYQDFKSSASYESLAYSEDNDSESRTVELETTQYQKDHAQLEELIKSVQANVLSKNQNQWYDQYDQPYQIGTWLLQIPITEKEAFDTALANDFYILNDHQNLENLTSEHDEYTKQLDRLHDRLKDVEEALKDKDLTTEEQNNLTEQKYDIEDDIDYYGTLLENQSNRTDYYQVSLTLAERETDLDNNLSAYIKYRVKDFSKNIFITIFNSIQFTLTVLPYALGLFLIYALLKKLNRKI